ncbi:MAG: type IV toxin-antitoxin system AbiEi family antitoxin [Thermodesulfobacteriota bacterium]
MGIGIPEKDILHLAVEKLKETTGFTVEVQHGINPEDANPVIRIRWQGQEWHFAAEVRRAVTRAMIGAAVQALRRHVVKGIMVVGHVTPQEADLLKETGTPFLDTAGNAYVNEPPLFVFIKGNKPAERHIGRPPIRAFRATGLQVAFALLCNPGLENARYREIAKAATVALGTVGWVMQDLKKMGNLIDMGRRGRRLAKKEKLLERWVTAYAEQLRPKRLLGRFKAANADWWKEAQLPAAEAHWGGEIAAAKLTGHLKPQTVTIYADELKALAQWLIRNRIRQDPDGDIEIIRKFWKFETHGEHPALTPPILIYADLLATGDARNMEIAGTIYEEAIARLVRED